MFVNESKSMQTNLSRELLNYFNQNFDQILDLIRRLIEIETPSGDVAGSRQIACALEQEAAKIAVIDRFEKIPIAGYGEHLIARAFSDSPEKPVLLLGHTDTVYPRGTLAARPFKIEGDKVFAPGIFDIKSGCAIMRAALRAFAELNLKPNRPITILLTCDEEVGSETGRALVEREAANAGVCFVCEPSGAGGAVKTGRKGTSYYELKTLGVAAHAGLEPEKGASAISELARQILEIEKLGDFAKGTTVNVTTVQGGTTSNVIAAEAACEIDVRFKSMHEAARIENAINSLTAIDARVKLEISGAINRPPLERTKAICELYEKARKIAESFDYDLRETEVGGASDGNFVAALGIAVLDGLGIKGDGAHAVHEHILRSDIAPRAAILTQLLLEI